MWYKSLLLHPFANRFNFLFLFTWAVVCLADPGASPIAFSTGLGLEIAYFGTRMALEFSGRPLWQLRFLKKEARERFFRLMARVRQIKTDFANAGTMRPLLDGQMKHIRKMSRVFLDLMILRTRIDAYVQGIHENYDQKISEIRSKLPTADGEIRKLLEQNLQIYEQRREKYFEVMGKRAVIEARLDAIENTLNLLGDYAMGMAAPDTAHDQIDLLVNNIQDAEKFIVDVQSTVPQTSSMRMRVKV